jgi:HKD family nuclease
MNIKFVDNRKNDHTKFVHRILNDNKCIYILVAFLKMSGIEQFEFELNNIINSKSKITFVVGLDFFITDPQALKKIYAIISKQEKSKLYLVQGNRQTFHPKIYCGTTVQRATFLVGSANMTLGGMQNNFEVSSYFSVNKTSEYYTEFKKYLSSIISHKKTNEANLLLIDQYQADHQIYNKKRKKAESEAKSEIKNQFHLDIHKLSKILTDYNSNSNELSNLTTKKENYRKAKKILKQLSSGNIKQEKDFVSLYNQLVGSEGQPSLWRSGGLSRQKTGIANKYRSFINMIIEMENNIGETPENLFEIGMSHAQNIKGLGVNVVTEVMNTYSPKQYSVLNKNPLSSLEHLGFTKFKGQGSFKPKDYQEYNSIICEFARLCEFNDLSQVDHFLNYIYWKYVKNE